MLHARPLQRTGSPFFGFHAKDLPQELPSRLVPGPVSHGKHGLPCPPLAARRPERPTRRPPVEFDSPSPDTGALPSHSSESPGELT